MNSIKLILLLTLASIFIGCGKAPDNIPAVDPFRPPLTKLSKETQDQAVALFAEFGKSSILSQVVENGSGKRDPNVGREIDPALKWELEHNCSFKKENDQYNIESTYVTGTDCPIEVSTIAKGRQPNEQSDFNNQVVDMKMSYLVKKSIALKHSALSSFSLSGVNTVSASRNESSFSMDVLLQGSISFIPFPLAKNEIIVENAATYFAIRSSFNQQRNLSEIRLGIKAQQWYELKVVEQFNRQTGEYIRHTYINDKLLDDKRGNQLPTLTLPTLPVKF